MSRKNLKKIIDSDSIRRKVKELGAIISASYADTNPVLIGVLNGSFIFLSDLIRNIDIVHETDFIKISSYTNGSSAGDIKLIHDISANIEGRDVLIVEDIVDTGYSLTYLKKHLNSYGPSSLKTCALVNKVERREAQVEIEFKGFDIHRGFLIGYGMDYKGWGRNLRDIYTLKTEMGD